MLNTDRSFCIRENKTSPREYQSKQMPNMFEGVMEALPKNQAVEILQK